MCSYISNIKYNHIIYINKHSKNSIIISINDMTITVVKGYIVIYIISNVYIYQIITINYKLILID